MKSQTLGRLFAVSALSAALAFAAAPRVMAGTRADMSPDVLAALCYAGAFLCLFPVLSFLSRHVSVTVKPQGV